MKYRLSYTALEKVMMDRTHIFEDLESVFEFIKYGKKDKIHNIKLEELELIEKDNKEQKMSKYIVKNCPARCNGMFKDCIGTSHNECENCTDCLIKQVIEKCKNIKKDHYWGMREIRFSQEILQLFEIEEVGNV